mgnify:FL=1
MENFFKLEIKALIENIPCVRVAITSFVSNLNITVDELMDIKTAVSEAVTNAIEHGYYNILTDKSTVIINGYYICDEYDKVKIEVIDTGIGIDDIELATTPAYTSKPELEHAGMGFTIMETFMDEVIIDSSKGSGTIITMLKNISKKKSS